MFISNLHLNHPIHYFYLKLLIMKTIYIIRHGKSSWDNPELPDEKRPITERGKKRTKKVAEFLVSQHINVDGIFSSHAVRAFETAKIIASGLNFPLNKIIINPHIYHANSDSLTDQIFALPETFHSIVIVGHNPTLTDFVNQFLVEPIENLPTSGVVSISFDTETWEDIPLAKRKTNFILFPKELE